MSESEKRKIRVSFRKNRGARPRRNDLTRAFDDDAADARGSERLSGKGDLTRRRTLVATQAGEQAQREIDADACIFGRVLWTSGANRSTVQPDDGGVEIRCSVRRVLRTMSRDARNLIVAGDRVLVRRTGPDAGVIERVEPRSSAIARTAGRQAHVLTANIEQAIIVVSADDPPLKLGVVDRFLVGAEKGGVQGVVCINKADLVSPILLQPIAGQYARIGYDVVLASARQGLGIETLRRRLRGRQSVIAGQSGVGKSSLLNAVQPGLDRRTGDITEETRKGTHTTRVAELIRLDFGGWVVDTPGFRKLEIWNVQTSELEGLFREFRPFVPGCRFQDCTHSHEGECAVQGAVDRGDISPLRYESYLRMLQNERYGLDRD
ncbi:MAG: ribosome small subunit-dependent GTPase A [Planctomyces sp.]|nr:ribosome small subunit-dependent GTPase A [Planctomyces sp.]